jgi:hypothetical protein
MSLNRSNPSDYRWRITRRNVALATIGYVEAPDAETAIKKAIKEFKITNIQIQQHLVAERIKRSAQRGRQLKKPQTGDLGRGSEGLVSGR